MATYYVSTPTSTPAGSDSNNGTAEATPWATIAKVNAKVFSAGDRVKFKCGEHWHEALRLVGAVNGYVAVTFDAYGTGASPLITGGIHLDSGWADQGSNIWRHTSVAQRTQVLIYNEAVTPIYQLSEDTIGAVVSQGKFFWDDTGDYIDMYSASDPGTYYSSIEGIQALAGTGAGPYIILMNGCAVRNLHFSKWGVNGFTLSNGQNFTFEYNHLDYIGGCKDAFGARDGQAFMPWQNFSGLVCRYNTFHDVYNVALTFQSSGAYTADTVKVYNNSVYDSYRALEIWQKDTSPVFTNWEIAHNVFYNCGGGAYLKQGTTARAALLYLLNNSSTSLNIRNNILHTVTTSYWYVANTNITGVAIDYNCYYAESGTKFRYNGTDYSFANWKGATPFDDNSITTDPNFTDTATYDFHLQNGSGCIDTGVAITGVNQAVVGAAPDMGMYEKPLEGFFKLCPFRKV